MKWWKVLYVAVPCFVAYLWLSMEQVIIFVIMVAIDIVLWTFVAKKFKWERISSRKWDNAMIKKIIKLMFPMLLILTWVSLWIDLEWLWSWILWYFIVTEMYSIRWHVYSIYSGELYEEEDAFLQSIKFIWKLLKKGKSKVEKTLEDKLD